jgi:hypothetical protein
LKIGIGQTHGKTWPKNVVMVHPKRSLSSTGLFSVWDVLKSSSLEDSGLQSLENQGSTDPRKGFDSRSRSCEPRNATKHLSRIRLSGQGEAEKAHSSNQPLSTWSVGTVSEKPGRSASATGPNFVQDQYQGSQVLECRIWNKSPLFAETENSRSR